MKMQALSLRYLAVATVAIVGALLLLDRQTHHHSSVYAWPMFTPKKVEGEWKEDEGTPEGRELRSKKEIKHQSRIRQRSISCQCKSLFTVAACGFQDIRSLKPSDPLWERALISLEEIQNYNTDQSYVDALEILSHSLPQKFRLHFDWNANKTSGSISGANAYLPFVKCSEHKYFPNDIRVCFRKMRDEVNRPLKISFLGDSRGRFVLKQFFQTVEHSLFVGSLNRIKLDTLYNTKLQEDWSIKFQTIEARLIWTPYLDEQGSNETSVPMREICSQTSTDVPDILVISYGAWPALFKENIEALNDYFYDVKKYRSCIANLAEHITIVWMLPSPMKISRTITDGVANPFLDLANSIAWIFFKNTKVILWDTREILSIKETNECYKLISSGLLDVVPIEWHCWDLHHAGTWTNARSVRMLLNLVCGSTEKNDDVNFCCQ